MNRMTPLGTVVNIAYNGSLIVRIKDVNSIPVKKLAADQMGNDVGRVTEIIGPVRSPYAVIRPFSKSLSGHNILRKELFLNPNENRRGDKNGRGRRGRKRKKGR